MDMDTQIEKFEEQRRRQKINDIVKINSQVAGLFEALNKPNQLPERIFVESFLPFFCGEIDIKQKPDVLLMWYGVAGSPSSEVSIIDNNRDVLFNVPALVDTSIINPIRGEGNNVSFSDIIALTNQYANSMPVVGERQLFQNLAVKEQELKSESRVFSQNEQRWIEIFKRYGKIKPTEIDIKAQAKDKGDLTDDDLEF